MNGKTAAETVKVSSCERSNYCLLSVASQDFPGVIGAPFASRTAKLTPITLKLARTESERTSENVRRERFDGLAGTGESNL